MINRWWIGAWYYETESIALLAVSSSDHGQAHYSNLNLDQINKLRKLINPAATSLTAKTTWTSPVSGEAP